MFFQLETVKFQITTQAHEFFFCSGISVKGISCGLKEKDEFFLRYEITNVAREIKAQNEISFIKLVAHAPAKSGDCFHDGEKSSSRLDLIKKKLKFSSLHPHGKYARCLSFCNPSCVFAYAL